MYEVKIPPNIAHIKYVQTLTSDVIFMTSLVMDLEATV